MSEAIRLITIGTRSRLAEAAVLADSLDRVHPGVARVLYLAEREVTEDDRACGWTVKPAADLPLPEPERFLFQYAPLQLCCALKPFALETELREPGTAGAVYVDGDMLALAPFLDLVEAAWRDADVGLTPHRRKPLPAAAHEYPLLRMGAYNAGFMAVSNAPDGLRFLSWLQQRFARDCVRDIQNGLFDDQKWLDLAAAVCPGVRPLRYAGINAGHWNLHEFAFEEKKDGILIDGAVRLALFHFSGLTPEALSKHAPSAPVPPPIEALAGRYREALAAKRARFPSDGRYSLGCFEDGAPILPVHREAVRQGRAKTDRPFEARAEVEAASAGLTPPAGTYEEAAAADLQLRRLRAHPVIGRVWRFWKRWVNHDLP